MPLTVLITSFPTIDPPVKPTSEPGVCPVVNMRSSEPLIPVSNAVTSQSDVPFAKELLIKVKAEGKPWKLTFMPVTVPVVTSMVSLPEKVVPVKVPNGVHVPETLNMSALAG